MSYIKPPVRIPFFLKLGVKVAEFKTKSVMLPGRILSWYPKAAIGAGVLEALIAHEDPGISKRMLKLIRMQVSFQVSCPFCIDMNSEDFMKESISNSEIEALQGIRTLESISTFSEKERLALRFTQELTFTPAEPKAATILAMNSNFNERQFVIIVSTIAQVNYWARLIKGFGVPPVGFTKECSILNLE